MTEECRNCRFWARRSDHAEEMGGGYCRRFPPMFPSGLRVYVNFNRTMNADHTHEVEPRSDFLNDAWPYTHQQSWCGEYAPAQPENGQ